MRLRLLVLFWRIDTKDVRDVFDAKPNDREKDEGFGGGVGCKISMSMTLYLTWGKRPRLERPPA